MSAEQGWVSPSDIADLAGVSRGAVSNWRKRSADFPEPVGGSASKPLFSVEEVGEWLKGRGVELKQDAGESRVWAAMNVLRGSLSVDEATDLLLSLLVARKTGSKGEELAWGEVDDKTRRRVQEAIDSVDVNDLSAVADFALERLSKSQGKKGADLGFVGSRTATLLANLAAARPGGTLYDPACGIAAALLQAVTLGAEPDRIVGHDLNERALRVAGQRAELHDVQLELAHTDVLAKDADPELRADVIILEPPFGLRYPDTPTRLTDPRFEFGTPPLLSADTAWLQHVVAHLSETGRGYVLTPHAVLGRDNEREIRAELVRQGCVETIIGLPGKLLPNITIPLALWVVRRPHTAPDPRILFIDASNESTPEDLAAGWLNDPAALRRVPHVDIPIADVLAQDSQLSPRLWLTRTEIAPGEIAATYAEARRDIHATADQIQTLSAFPGPTNLPKSRVMTVGELLDEGVLEQSTGKPAERYADVAPELQERIATAADVRDATLRRTALPEGHDQHPDLTHKGDVLVTTMHTIRARVDTTGGHLPSTGVHRLRIVKEDLLKPAYLATALTGAWNKRFQTGTTIRRAALRDLEIPIIPPDDQTSIQAAAATLDQLHSTAQDLAARAATARTALLDAVRHNAPLTHTPEPQPQTPSSATPTPDKPTSPTEDATMTTPAPTDASTLADLPGTEGARRGN